MAITMTSAAQQHVRRHLEHRAKGVGVRLGVRTTGCSGLSYVLELLMMPQQVMKSLNLTKLSW